MKTTVEMEEHYRPKTLQEQIIQWANKWGYKGVAPECIKDLKDILKSHQLVADYLPRLPAKQSDDTQQKCNLAMGSKGKIATPSNAQPADNNPKNEDGEKRWD